MRKSFSIGAAGIAIAMSLAGTAHAQDGADDQVAYVAMEEGAALAISELNDAESSVILAPVSVTKTAAAAYPADLLISDLETATIAPQIDMVSDSHGVVTPQSVDPLYGDIDAFYGDINPFYGDIDAFWGHINPFYGDINAFYGDIDAFWGDINPFYGDINAFWGDIDAFYGDINAFDTAHLESLGDFWQATGDQVRVTEQVWAALRTTEQNGRIVPVYDGTPNEVLSALNTLINQAENQFASVYETETGKSFRSDLVAEILARHGIDLNDKVSLAGKSASDRAAFFLDWHDSLNAYSGIDHVDHWMASINWTPEITQIQGGGAQTVIGIIDGSFSADADLGDNVIWSGGYSNDLMGHGAGVASLIAAAHDGEGVMGIAPNVNISTYNPFDHTGTSNWDEVADGIVALQQANLVNLNGFGRTSIINLSLGESGYALSAGLAEVLSRPEVVQYHSDTVFVVAAGNDGIVQTTDIEWDYSNDPALILVGSVNPLGEISSFSNRPGSACLLDNGVCHSGNELFRRTIVAPGELILVSDGMGGVTRRSGTSFAAPLVSGTVALLHDRWPWLNQHPEETVEIIFRSARDLGAPGPDEIYGHGLLDVAASQSPLNFNQASFSFYNWNGSRWVQQTLAPSDLAGAGIPDWWQTQHAFAILFEDVGNTYRDFTVPLSSFTEGNSINSRGTGRQRFQDFITSRFARWINSNGKDSNGDGRDGLLEVRSNHSNLNGEWSFRYDAVMPYYAQEGDLRPVHNAATLTNPKGTVSFTLGHGQGSMALNGYRFGVMSDHDPFTGGVNPVLGFASGELFAAASYSMASGMTVRVGYSENREQWDEIRGLTAEQRQARRALGDRPATAFSLDLEQRVNDRVSLNAQYTRLREDNALLGTQTSINALLGNGSRTEAMTVSATVDMGDGLTFDLSATGARTETANGQIFASSGDVWSSAGQVTATKRGLFSSRDMLRLSVAQPLKIEDGSLELRSDAVIDRETGERGIVTQRIGIETRRQIAGEAIYAMPLTSSSEFGVFGRYVSAGETNNEADMVVGGNFSLRF